MALKAYTLDLALQSSSEFAIGNTIPDVPGIATDGSGFIPTKNSTNKTITLSKGFGKFGGRLFEMTEQTVYSWDSGTADADAYLVIDLTKQNSFTGTIEDGTYSFVDNQSSIVLSDTVPNPSSNSLVYKLDGDYQTDLKRKFSSVSVSGQLSADSFSTTSANLTMNGTWTMSNFQLVKRSGTVFFDGYLRRNVAGRVDTNTYFATMPSSFAPSVPSLLVHGSVNSAVPAEIVVSSNGQLALLPVYSIILGDLFKFSTTDDIRISGSWPAKQ